MLVSYCYHYCPARLHWTWEKGRLIVQLTNMTYGTSSKERRYHSQVAAATEQARKVWPGVMISWGKSHFNHLNEHTKDESVQRLHVIFIVRFPKSLQTTDFLRWPSPPHTKRKKKSHHVMKVLLQPNSCNNYLKCKRRVRLQAVLLWWRTEWLTAEKSAADLRRATMLRHGRTIYKMGLTMVCSFTRGINKALNMNLCGDEKYTLDTLTSVPSAFIIPWAQPICLTMSTRLHG